MTMIALGLLILVVAFFAVPLIDTLKRIAEGIEQMADLEAQAIADLSAVADEAIALIEKQAAALAAAGSPVDHSADIVAIKQKLAAVVAPAAPSA